MPRTRASLAFAPWFPAVCSHPLTLKRRGSRTARDRRVGRGDHPQAAARRDATPPVFSSRSPVFRRSPPVFGSRSPLFWCSPVVFSSRSPVFWCSTLVFSSRSPVFWCSPPVFSSRSPVFWRSPLVSGPDHQCSDARHWCSAADHWWPEARPRCGPPEN